MQPIITRPNRTVFVSAKSTGMQQTPSAAISQNLNSYTPVSPSSNLIVPRAPVVHFFICDYGNAKVKSLQELHSEIHDK